MVPATAADATVTADASLDAVSNDVASAISPLAASSAA